LDPTTVARFLGLGNRLISKVGVTGPDRARDTIDLVATTVDAPAGIVEHASSVKTSAMAARRRAGSFSPKTS